MIIGIFNHFFSLETTLSERQFFKALAKLIGKRSARLSACGIAAIVSKMGYLEEECAVGADGSLYNVCFLRHTLTPNNSMRKIVSNWSFLHRNTRDSQIEYMKGLLIYSVRREGKLF
jgi:hexokinase